MFCADYVASFVCHVLMISGVAISMDKDRAREFVGLSKKKDGAIVVRPVVFGSLAGFLGASALFPFDFVRKSLAPTGTSNRVLYMTSLSSVAYSTPFFGLYFCARDPTSLKSQSIWALISANVAMLSELPFDHAKRTLFKSRPAHIAANMLYTPFAAMMLLLYDKGLQRRLL